MLRPVQAVHRQVVEPLETQALQDPAQLNLALLQREAREQLAGDHQRLRSTPLAEGLAQEGLRGAIGRGGFDVVDARG